MLRNYLKVALRNLVGEAGYSTLNVAGLAVAMAMFMLVLLFVSDELSYDRAHPGADRLYRVAADVKIGERVIRAPLTPGPLAPTLEADLPQVERALHVHNAPRKVSRGGEGRDELFLEQGFLYTEPAFFDLFAFPFTAGSEADALAEPFSVVLTEATAEKYFGRGVDPTGRDLLVGGDAYTVTGVVDAAALPSHMEFGFVAPLATLDRGPWVDSWLANNFYTYFRLADGASAAAVRDALPRLIEQRIGEPFAHSLGTSFEEFLANGGRFEYRLQSVPEIHLRSNLEFELGDNGSLRRVQVLALLAAFVLLIACINYMNLATARAGRRSLEVGLRKTLGARPAQLRLQFVLEALLTSFAALAVGFVLAALCLDRFNALVGKGFTVADLASPGVVLTMVGLWLLVALASGSYPAFVLSAFPPVSMVERGGGGGARWLRNGLVVFQFAVGVVLIVGSLVVARQVGFLLDKELGFEADDVLVVEGASALGDDWRAAKQEMLRSPAIEAVAGASALPGGGEPREVFLGRAGEVDEETQTAWMIDADADWFDTLGVATPAGERYRHQDGRAVALISPLAAERLGWDDPVGERLRLSARPGEPTVIGTVADLHVQSLRRELKPLVVRPLTTPPAVLAVRYADGEREAALSGLEEVWRGFAGGEPLAYLSLEARIADLYRDERRVLAMTRALTAVALFVAALGIVGLAAYAAHRRTQEIGVRKVLGAKPEGIALLLARDFLKLVGVAVVVALPLAAWAAGSWLDGFAYRATIPWWIYLVAAGATLLVALVSVTVQALRAAGVRPAISLRYE